MADLGFTWDIRKTGEVKVFHHGNLAATLRGTNAPDFLELTGGGDNAMIQQDLAPVSGNYKRGNERLAKRHPRNA